jgi:hypothetical protein
MIKIRAYEHTDHYVLDNLIKAHYSEKKIQCPEPGQIFETLGFFNTYPQCGKIYMIFYNNEPVGYCIVINIWRNRYSKISYMIDELYIQKDCQKHKLEIDLVEFLIKTENIHGISIKYSELNPFSKKVFTSIKFEHDTNQIYYKVVEI